MPTVTSGVKLCTDDSNSICETTLSEAGDGGEAGE